MATEAGAGNSMERLIPIVNKLQDIFSQMGFSSIDLPQICVVGAQSSGKSSVLESLVGKDFLPRGSGICTRRPLILQLNNTPGTAEWGEFTHKPGQKFEDFLDIMKEIEDDTAKIAGGNKGISDQPINLKVFSPHVLNLTLVDLPGLIKVPVGDQPPDIARQCEKLVTKFAEKESCIILAVTPANQDVATSDALQFAKKMDPKGKRTVGIITKIDLMDKGTDCSEVLMGKVVPLRRGFLGVINRSQADVEGRKPIHEARASEMEFFEEHDVYKEMLGTLRLGTQKMGETLNTTLMVHIHDQLPTLRRRISGLADKTRAQLSSFGDTVPSTSSLEVYVRNLLLNFEKQFRSLIEGGRGAEMTGELMGGARISFIFNDVYARALNEVDPLQGVTSDRIRMSLKNSAGHSTAIFIPDATFENLLKPQIAKLKGPSLECAELVFQELMRMVYQCTRQDMKRFTKLVDKVSTTTEAMLRRQLNHTRQMVTDMIMMELAYINIHHPNFVGTHGAIRDLMSQKGGLETVQKADSEKKQGGEATVAANNVLGLSKNKVHDGPMNKRGRNFPWSWGKRYFLVDGSRVRPALHYFNDPQKASECRGTMLLTNCIIEEIAEDKASVKHCFQVIQEDQIENGEPLRWLVHCAAEDEVDAWINAIQKCAPVRRVRRLGDTDDEEVDDRDDYTARVDTGVVAVPKGSAAVIARIFGSAAAMRIQKENAAGDQVRLPKVPASAKLAGRITDSEQLRIDVCRGMIPSYFNVVRRNLVDGVPKTIMHVLVNEVKDQMQNCLLDCLYGDRSQDIAELLEEDRDIVRQKERCKVFLGLLDRAMDVVQEAQDFRA